MNNLLIIYKLPFLVKILINNIMTFLFKKFVFIVIFDFYFHFHKIGVYSLVRIVHCGVYLKSTTPDSGNRLLQQPFKAFLRDRTSWIAIRSTEKSWGGNMSSSSSISRVWISITLLTVCFPQKIWDSNGWERGEPYFRWRVVVGRHWATAWKRFRPFRQNYRFSGRVLISISISFPPVVYWDIWKNKEMFGHVSLVSEIISWFLFNWFPRVLFFWHLRVTTKPFLYRCIDIDLNLISWTWVLHTSGCIWYITASRLFALMKVCLFILFFDRFAPAPPLYEGSSLYLDTGEVQTECVETRSGIIGFPALALGWW